MFNDRQTSLLIPIRGSAREIEDITNRCLCLSLEVIWFAAEIEDGVQLSLTSPDGDQGYPGEVHVSVSYTLRVCGSLQ